MTGTGSEVTDTVDDAIEAALQPFEPLAFTVYDPLAETLIEDVVAPVLHK